MITAPGRVPCDTAIYDICAHMSTVYASVHVAVLALLLELLWVYLPMYFKVYAVSNTVELCTCGVRTLLIGRVHVSLCIHIGVTYWARRTRRVKHMICVSATTLTAAAHIVLMLNTMLHVYVRMQDEYKLHKEATDKFIRRVDMLQCEVDELTEENIVSVVYTRLVPMIESVCWLCCKCTARECVTPCIGILQ